MTYIHEFEIVDDKLTAKENKARSGFLTFELQENNSLKIDNFVSGCTDPDYHQGTEMILYLLRYFVDSNISITSIHGVLSTEDAKDEIIEIELVKKRVGWHVSIPFYADLTNYIPNSKFYLYDGSNFYLKNDITSEYHNNPDECIDYLIEQNQNCSFSIVIDVI